MIDAAAIKDKQPHWNSYRSGINVLNFNRQLGASSIGLMFTIVMLVFCALFVVKLAPIYLTDAAVKGMMKTLEEDEADFIGTASKKQILTSIRKRLSINQVTGLGEGDITVTKNRTEVIVRIAYEVRTAMLANIDTVLKFDHKFSVNRKSED